MKCGNNLVVVLLHVEFKLRNQMKLFPVLVFLLTVCLQQTVVAPAPKTSAKTTDDLGDETPSYTLPQPPKTVSSLEFE